MNKIIPIVLSLFATVFINIAMADTEEKDAETMRFESELRKSSQSMRYPPREEVIASQVSVFQMSAAEYRRAIWDALEIDRVKLNEQNEQEVAAAQRVQDMPIDEMDAETLRYKAAIEQKSLPPDAIEDLVEMFQANDATMREMLWQRVQESPLRK
jgi:hypothetical protein